MDKYFRSAAMMHTPSRHHLCHSSIHSSIAVAKHNRIWINWYCFSSGVCYSNWQCTIIHRALNLSISCGFLKQRKFLTATARGNNNKIIIVLFMIALAKYRYYKPHKIVNVCIFAPFSNTTLDCVTFCNCFIKRKKKFSRIERARNFFFLFTSYQEQQ